MFKEPALTLGLGLALLLPRTMAFHQPSSLRLLHSCLPLRRILSFALVLLILSFGLPCRNLVYP
jgi:hypothetical protein